MRALQVPGELRVILFEDLKRQVTIAKGGFGVVRSAKLDGFTDVVLKTSKIAGTINRASILKELHFMKDMNMRHHQNVARILGVCVDDPSGELGIVMDKCEYSLAMYLKDHASKVRNCTVLAFFGNFAFPGFPRLVYSAISAAATVLFCSR